MTEENEVTEAEIVAEPNPGFYHLSESSNGGGEMSTHQRLRQIYHSHSVLMEPHQPTPHDTLSELVDHELSAQGSSSDFRPRRLRHPWNYDNRCYHGQFHNPVSCPCREQHDMPDGGFYQTPPPAHRSSLYPGSMPESPGLGRNRLLRAVQRMNPRHQRLWQMQNNHQEQMRRQMAPARTAPQATLPGSSLEGRAEVQHPVTVEEGAQEHQAVNGSGGSSMSGTQDSHPRETIRTGEPVRAIPMITVPRIMIGSRPAGTPPMQNPPPAHVQSGQQRMFEDPSGRYRRYQQSLHRWHTPVMPDPPTLAFHPGLDDNLLPHYPAPVPHYHNPWNSNPNIRAHMNLPDPELGVMIPRPTENYPHPRGLENYGGIANFLLQPRSMVGIEVNNFL